MLTDTQLVELTETVKKMIVEIPAKLEDFHEAILRMHAYLNALTEAKILIAQEVFKYKDDKEYIAKLKYLNREVVEPMIRQLTIGKQTFNMLIGKGRAYDKMGKRPEKPDKELVDKSVVEFNNLMQVVGTEKKVVDEKPPTGDNGFVFSE